MSSPSHYDQSLLAAAPKTTKKQFQEGYTTEGLLESPLFKSPLPTATPPPLPRTSPRRTSTDLEVGLVSKEKSGHTTPVKPIPFWRTRKGFIIIFVAAVVIVAVIIGGAVGGSVSNKKKKKQQNTSQGPGESGADTFSSSSNSTVLSTPPIDSTKGAQPPTSTGTTPGSIPPTATHLVSVPDVPVDEIDGIRG